MATIMVRVSEGQKELWVGAAHDERVSLSEWIRRRCDGGLVRPSDVASTAGGGVTDTASVRESRVSGGSGSPGGLTSQSFRPDPKGGKVRGLGSGEVLAAGSPPVTVAPVSPEPSPLAAGATANTGGRATRPPMSASGSSEGEVSDAVTPAASGPSFRPDPKKK